AVLLLFLLVPVAMAAPKIKPWMLADWVNDAPHLADLGLKPSDFSARLDNRLLVFAHPVRDITLPGAKGPRPFRAARFVSSVAVVDLPAHALRQRMRDIPAYKTLFPMLTDSGVEALDGRNMVTRFRVEIPLPALATIAVDFRAKQAFEDDGSISGMLIDGQAKSLIAMLGGMTDELADQPVLTRWEFLPVDANRSLLVFTYWDRIELKSFFARKFMEAYPELQSIGPYIAAAGGVESIRRNYSLSTRLPVTPGIPGWASMEKLQPLLDRLSVHGQIGVLEPEQAVAVTQKKKPLRYSAVAMRMNASPEATRRLSTLYERIPDVQKEIRRIDVKDRGREVDLGLSVHFGVLVIRFGFDMDMHLQWPTPERLEYRRRSGGLARLDGAAEWHPTRAGDDTVMLSVAAHEIGDEAPLMLRLAHKIVEQIPFAEAVASMAVQMVMLERLKPWVERQAGQEATKP
ncbi:MAG: hypothetical protein Q8J78_16980, partial [Moraxellaceae bacterium]|nr:hypothetical protein [Moraxellaceae bacterium]